MTVELSAGRWRWCRLFGVEVVQSQTDLLSGLGAYRPSLSPVATLWRVGQHYASQVP